MNIVTYIDPGKKPAEPLTIESNYGTLRAAIAARAERRTAVRSRRVFANKRTTRSALSFLRPLIYTAWIFCFLVSCGPKTSKIPVPYIKNSIGVPVTHCNKDVLTYSIMSNVAAHHRTAVHKAFQYWNEVLGTEVFKPATSLELPNVWIMKDQYMRDGCAYTQLRWDTSACFVHTLYVVYMNPCAYKDENIFETLMRHELGHVLGLGNMYHSNSHDYLMHYMIYNQGEHPKDALPSEIEKTKELWEERHQ